MKQAYFPWYQAAKKIELIESDGIKKVLLNGKLYMSWASWDSATQRMVIAQLHNCQFATQQDLSEVFNIHRNSVQKYIAEFAREGLEGLISQRSGPRESWKITADVRAKILIIVLKQGILGYEAIQKRLEAWNEYVSIASIRQVLLENGFVDEKVRVGNIEFEQSSLFDTGNEKQLRLPFSDDWKLAKRKESSLEVEKRVIDFATYEGYSFEELCTTLFYLDVFGFRSLGSRPNVFL
jgi:transposase